MAWYLAIYFTLLYVSLYHRNAVTPTLNVNPDELPTSLLPSLIYNLWTRDFPLASYVHVILSGPEST